MPVSCKYLRYLGFGETEHGVALIVKDVVSIQVVQTREKVLLGDLHHACHDRKLERVVGLKRIRIESPEEFQDIRI